VVELVDAPDSKSGSARSVGSIPTARTTFSNRACQVRGSDPFARSGFSLENHSVIEGAVVAVLRVAREHPGGGVPQFDDPHFGVVRIETETAERRRAH